jgi:Tol biopolymer transport system component
MDTIGVTMLAGTDGASYPFWSPDGSSIAFFADDKLKRIAIGGAPPQILCVATRGRGGSWHRNGTVLFASTVEGTERLQWLPDSGGAPKVVRVLEQPTSLHRWPHFLPDGRHFVFFFTNRDPATDGVYVGSLDDSTATRLVPGFVEARYHNGYLFYVRDNALVAQGFDVARGVLAPGEPMLIAPAVEGAITKQVEPFPYLRQGLSSSYRRPRKRCAACNGSVPKANWLESSGNPLRSDLLGSLRMARASSASLIPARASKTASSG